MDRTTLAATTHTLADINTLPWWAQLAIGLGLVTIAMVFGWLARRADEDAGCLPSLVSGGFTIAGLVVLYNVLFGG